MLKLQDVTLYGSAMLINMTLLVITSNKTAHIHSRSLPTVKTV